MRIGDQAETAARASADRGLACWLGGISPESRSAAPGWPVVPRRGDSGAAAEQRDGSEGQRGQPSEGEE
jgi:hypothetical protein